MIAQQMDAASSFVYLIDNIPTWTTQLAALSLHAVQKQQEFIAEYTKLIDDLKPKIDRVRSPSLHSIQSDPQRNTEPRSSSGDSTTVKDLSSPTPHQSAIKPLISEKDDIIVQLSQKRKPESLVRSGASGPAKYRTKRQIVIHYDSHVQNELEAMVKAIGTARNNLRKGKNALMAGKGFKLPSLRRNTNWATTIAPYEDGRSHASPRSPSMMKAKYAVPSTPRQSNDDDEASFMRTDKALEMIQNLCETAAHQFLRDGDCRAEIASSIIHLERVLKDVRMVEEGLRKNAEKEAEPCSNYPEIECGSFSCFEKVTPLIGQTSLPNPVMSNEKGTIIPGEQVVEGNKFSTKFATSVVMSMPEISSLPAACVEIEVDDESDDSDIEVDIINFRMANTRRVVAY